MFIVKNRSDKTQCITFNREGAPLTIPAGGSQPVNERLRSFFEPLGWAEIQEIEPIVIESIGPVQLEEDKPKPVKRAPARKKPLRARAKIHK